MKNTTIIPGESILVSAVHGSQIPTAARDLVDVYFDTDFIGECVSHGEDCNIKTKQIKNRGCTCSFGKFSGAIFALKNKLKAEGIA